MRAARVRLHDKLRFQSLGIMSNKFPYSLPLLLELCGSCVVMVLVPVLRLRLLRRAIVEEAQVIIIGDQFLDLLLSQILLIIGHTGNLIGPLDTAQANGDLLFTRQLHFARCH